MKISRFIFQIAIDAKPYSPETCKEDFGSAEAYNSDFPSHVYAGQHIDQLFKEAYLWCNYMMSSMSARLKTPIETWEQHEQDLYIRYEKRMEYWDKLRNEVECVKEIKL